MWGENFRCLICYTGRDQASPEDDGGLPGGGSAADGDRTDEDDVVPYEDRMLHKTTCGCILPVCRNCSREIQDNAAEPQDAGIPISKRNRVGSGGGVCWGRGI